MDALKSGAIFRLKNMAVVRSPPPIPSSKGADHSIAKTVQKDNSSVVENRAPDESAVIKRRFDEIYRSTPTPAAMLSRNYYWDQAPAQNTPTSSNSMQYAGTHYSGYRPVQSMLYCDSSSLQQSDAVSGSMNMPPPLLPATFTPSQFRSRSPALNTLQPLLEDSEPVKGEALRIMDSTPTSSTNTALADNIDYNESSTDLVDDDNDMQIAETNICDSRDHAKSRSVGTSSGGGGLSRSRGRLAGPNILMNLTSSKPTASSSSSSLLHGATITVAARSPPSSSSMSSLQNEASPKFARHNKRTENSPEAKLSFMSNMSQTKRRRSPAGRLLADDSVYLLSEEPVFSSVSEKGIADRQRYGSLTLVPMSSLLSGSAFNDYSSDDSSSNSSDSDNSRREKSAVALKLPSRDTRLRIAKSNVTGSIGRLQKMSDIIAKSRSPAHCEKLSSDSEKSEYDLSEYHFKASSSSCTDSTPHTERMGTEEKEVAADNESTDVSRILEEKRIESLVEDRIIIHTSAIDAFNTASSDSLNTSPLSHPILRSAIEPEGVLINTVLTSSGTGQAELKPKRTISRSRAAGIEESEVTGVTDNVAIKNGAETRRATRTSTVGADKNGQVVRSSVSIASTSSSSGVHSNSRFGSSSTNGSSSETVTQREWLAEEVGIPFIYSILLLK